MAATRLEKVQIGFTVLTPLLLGLGGLWLNGEQQQITKQQKDIELRQSAISGQLSELQTRTVRVQAMSDLFDRLVDSDSSKGKMAAYALYMLNREDPEMVVSLVLASDRPALNSVLVDLGSREPVIRNLITRRLPAQGGGPGDAHAQSTVAANATSVLEQMQVERSGWSYIGTFRNGRWAHGPTVKIAQAPPRVGQRYEVETSLYLRVAAPDSLYRHGEIRGVIPEGDFLQIEELKQYGNRWWARVTVIHDADTQPAD